MVPRYLLPAALLLVTTQAVIAQWIPIRTVPLIATDQGDFSPSIARGMGNLSFILDDPLRDPFLNPAKAGTLNRTFVFTSPIRNSWSNDEGRAVGTFWSSSQYKGSITNSLPFGTFGSWGDFFGGVVVAYQGLASERVTTTLPSPLVAPTPVYSGSSTQNDLGSNAHLFGLIGHRFPSSGISVGGSISWANYSAIDGVQLLYPGSTDIEQDGWSLESKVGIVADIADESKLEFLAGRGIFKATHQVMSETFGRGPIPFISVIETNSDERRDWLLHGGYSRLINDSWKVGLIATVNWKDHPNLPNYRLTDIPRDPGTSVAYNFGIGASWSRDNLFWGLEYIYEPIRSNTWAEFGEGGQVIFPPAIYPSDFKTIENFFDFSNHIIRVGHRGSSEEKWKWLEYRFGAQFHIYSYSLTQNDNILKTSRFFETDWLETTLSGGLTAHIGQVDLMYTLQLVFGNGTVGNDHTFFTNTGELGASNAPDFLIAPAGDLVVDDITLVTQQIAVVFALN